LAARTVYDADTQHGFTGKRPACNEECASRTVLIAFIARKVRSVLPELFERHSVSRGAIQVCLGSSRWALWRNNHTKIKSRG
jgi:hypothetical protein